MQTSKSKLPISKLVQFTNFDQVVERVQRELLNGKNYQRHKVSGTLSAYYDQLVKSAVTDMVAVPLHRELAELEPITDPEELALAFAILADTMGTVFKKTFATVQNDLVDTVNELPVEDIRQAIVYRHDNRLH